MPITGPLFEYFVMGDDLVLRFLQLHQLAKLVRFAGLALAYDLGVRFKQTQQFSRKLGQACEHPRLGRQRHHIVSGQHRKG